MALMTAAEYIKHFEDWYVNDPEMWEGLYEQISEIAGEIARFGDSGPGTLYRLRQEAQRYNRAARQYERLSGRTAPKFPALPHPR